MCKGDRMKLPRLAAGAVAGVFTVTGLTACVGGDDDAQPECAPAEEAMATAKDRIDGTEGLDIVLHTSDTSSGIHVVNASVTVVRPDSFEGTFTGAFAGATLDGEIVGIGDTVWAQAPVLWPDWSEVDTAQYPIPNLATLLSPDDGLSSTLVMTEGLSDPEMERDEDDARSILCYYDGTLPADAVAQIIPSAAGEDFTMEYAVDGDGALRKATLTGDPYGRDEQMTYVLDVTAYDVESDIQPPV